MAERSSANIEAKGWQIDTASARLDIISPLLREEMDSAARRQKAKEIAIAHDVSTKTISRWYKAYKADGLKGLIPQERASPHREESEIYDRVMPRVIQMKREVPTRSIRIIIRTIELIGEAPKGVLKRSTIQVRLQKLGLSTRILKSHQDEVTNAARRFCKPNRMMLVQCDIKYGNKIRKDLTLTGAVSQAYLITMLDDHSRLPLFSKWSCSQTGQKVENGFREAILKYGRFDEAYCDNGKQYVQKHLRDTLAILGITIRFAPVKSGQSKGKIEKYHQVVDSFLAEEAIAPSVSEFELNERWSNYLEAFYLDEPHEGIAEYYETNGIPLPKEGVSPREEFQKDPRPLQFYDVDTVVDAFRWRETRKVTKGCLISVGGIKFGVDASLRGYTVEVIYDKNDLSEVVVKYKDMEPIKAKPVKIGAFIGQKKTPEPVGVQRVKATKSVVLEAAARAAKEKARLQTGAISYADLEKNRKTP